MSFRLKAAGEQELKICNRNGGLSGGGWGGGRPGGSELMGLEGQGRGGLEGGETPAKREPATFKFRFEPEKRDRRGGWRACGDYSIAGGGQL